MLNVRNAFFAAAAVSLPVLTGCSAGSGISTVTPAIANASTLDATSGRATTQSTVSQASLFAPSAFPASALAGARSRIASSSWDWGGVSSPTVRLDGPGSYGSKVTTYTRPDGRSVIAIYWPEGTPVASGWLAIYTNQSVRVPEESSYSDGTGWADQAPWWLNASSTLYFQPARVVLIDVRGPDVKAAPVPATAAPATSVPASPSASPLPSMIPRNPNPSPFPIGSPTAAPRPTVAPTIAPTVAPTVRPTIAPTVAPTPPATNGEGPATGGTGCPHFQSNPVCAPLPAQPNVSAASGAWAALVMQSGRAYFPNFNGYIPAGTTSQNDGSLPLDDLPAGAPSVPQMIDCDVVSWGLGTCRGNGIQGKMIDVPAIMLPAGNSDHHYSWNDERAQGEYDFWLAPARGSSDATMHLGGGGFCRWSGDGTGCSGSTATNIASSLGTIHAYALKAAEADPVHGTLGYAIATTALCADPSWVYPATFSDGANTNSSSACAGHTASGQRPPEGTRWFLALTDDQIDATNNAPYVKVLLRTMDEQHFGGFISDTNWSGAPGLTPQYDRGDFRFAAAEAGASTGAYGQVPFTLHGIDLAASVRFCTSGSCR